MPLNFLLIGRPEDTNWSLILSQALAPLGKLETASEIDAVERTADYECDAIAIIDATVIEDVPALVSRLRDRCPQMRVVVATVSPTWQRARDAFRAGVVDYIRKSWNSEDLLTAIRDILGRPLPHRAEPL